MALTNDDVKVVDQKTAAELLGVSTKTMEGWRWVHEGPHYIKMGRLVRYRLSDLKDFIDRQKVETRGRA